MKTKFNFIELYIIRWALKRLKPVLPLLQDKTFYTLEKFGIADLHENEFTKEIAIYID